MAQASPLPICIAGGIGAVIARLVTGPWPSDAGDWIGVAGLAVAVAVGAYLALRFIARRRQP